MNAHRTTLTRLHQEAADRERRFIDAAAASAVLGALARRRVHLAELRRKERAR